MPRHATSHDATHLVTHLDPSTSLARAWTANAFLVTSLAIALGAPLAAAAGPKRIGTLHTSSAKDEADRVAALTRGLAELGHVVGRDVVFVNRNAGQHMSRLPELAAR